MSSIFANIRFGLCWWDLVALIILLVVIGLCIVRTGKYRRKKSALEGQLAEIYAARTFDEDY